jgi:hypothetical protein
VIAQESVAVNTASEHSDAPTDGASDGTTAASGDTSAGAGASMDDNDVAESSVSVSSTSTHETQPQPQHQAVEAVGEQQTQMPVQQSSQAADVLASTAIGNTSPPSTDIDTSVPTPAPVVSAETTGTTDIPATTIPSAPVSVPPSADGQPTTEHDHAITTDSGVQQDDNTMTD